MGQLWLALNTTHDHVTATTFVVTARDSFCAMELSRFPSALHFNGTTFLVRFHDLFLFDHASYFLSLSKNSSSFPFYLNFCLSHPLSYFYNFIYHSLFWSFKLVNDFTDLYLYFSKMNSKVREPLLKDGEWRNLWREIFIDEQGEEAFEKRLKTQFDVRHIKVTICSLQLPLCK